MVTQHFSNCSSSVSKAISLSNNYDDVYPVGRTFMVCTKLLLNLIHLSYRAERNSYNIYIY
jgi:hypothetical protein